MKIRTKLGAGLTVVILTFALAVGVYYFALQNTVREYEDVANTHQKVRFHAVEMEKNMLKAQRYTKDFLLENDEKSPEIAGKALSSATTHIEELLSLQEKMQNEDAAKELKKVSSSMVKFNQHFDGMVDAQIGCGLDEKSGLRGQFRDAAHTVEKEFAKNNLRELQISLLQMQRAEKDYMLRGKEKDIKKVKAILTDLTEGVEGSSLDDEAKEEVTSALWTYGLMFDGIIDGKAEVKQYLSKMRDASAKITPIVEKMSDEAEKKMEDAIDMTRKNANRMADIALTVAGLAVVIGVIIGVILTRTVTKPLKLASDFARRFADGDLTVRLDLNRKDEFGILADKLDAMAENLESMMREIGSGASNLSVSSNKLSETANVLADGAKRMSSQSTTVAAASEEMATNMTTMSDSTEGVSSSMNTVSSSVDQMTESVAEIAKSAGETSSIAEQASALAEESNEKISHLGSAADEIGKVIEVIQDIAEQTNLLALNATIEAARAGEAGKGFAVVATEVKELAKQTAEATEDIAARIQAIQDSTTKSVKSIGQIGEVINKVNDASRTIASAVEEQSITTKEIAQNISQAAAASETVSTNISESAAASKEISQNIAGVDQEARQSAEGASQTQAVSLEMLQMSEKLQALVEKFKIGDGEISKDYSSDPFIPWSNQFSVNVPEMDAQHKKLLGLVNQLHSAMKNQHAQEKVGAIIDSLIQYTIEHFASEEEYMSKHQFEGLEEQKMVHKQFVNKVKSFEADYLAGEAALSGDVLKFLSDWLLNHIGKMDKQYGMQTCDV